MIAVKKPPARRPLRTVLAGAFVVVTLGIVVFAGYWAITGGRWYVVKTPSMGTAAPVGTLLWVQPTKITDLHVGEFITFHPPHSTLTYSHRVFALNSDGTVSTKGQITAPDPWKLTAADIVGKVDMRWWGMGWLVRAAPLLIIGGLAVWFGLRRFASPQWRLPVAVVGTAVLLCIAVVVLHPLTRAERLSSVAEGSGGRATYISTGLLPLRLDAGHGAHVDLRDGQVGSVLSTHVDRHGLAPVALRPHISWSFWLVLVLTCFLPALWTVFVGARSVAPGRHRVAVA
jgi:hypothetical protein